MLRKLVEKILGTKQAPAISPKAQEETAEERNLRVLNQIKSSLLSAPDVSSISIKKLLEIMSDDFYFWLLTDGCELDPSVKKYLPSMPAEIIQSSYTGSSGHATLREAYLAYKIFKQLAKSNSIDIRNCNNVLDFGCGWGRIIRFFLKDVEASALHGVDIDNAMIDICKLSNLNCSFHIISPMPPTHFPDLMFDFIYLYSVFTHLSEEAHLKWLLEFKRLLRPGGVLIATTRPRSFILHCAEIRKTQDIESWKSGAARSFTDTEQMLQVYDRGEYCHSASGGGVIQDKSFYGETCISKSYAEKNWTKYFSFVDLISDLELKNYYQDIIIAKK